MLFWTGLRIGELLALRPCDIDLDARTLTVNKSFQTIDGKEVITEPKTPRSRRVIPMPEKLCDEIREYEAALYEPDPDDRLFPFTKHYFHQQMAKGCEASGVEKIRMHDLRHTFATLSLKNGVDVKTLSGALGHYSAGFTLNTYTHATAQMKQEAADTIGNVISQAM